MKSITTKPMTANHELQNCLTKAISEFKVRDMLTKFGIPEDTEVTLKLQLDENSEPIASCSVPTAVKQEHISGSMSLISLQESLIDNFINPAIKTFDLSRHIADVEETIEDDENKLIIGLNTKDPNCRMDLIFTSCCCVPGCNRCCAHCRC